MLGCFLSIIKEDLSPRSVNLGRVMEFIAAVCENLDWALLKILSDTMTEFVKFDPITKPSGCRVNVADIEIKYVGLFHLYGIIQL